MRGRALGPGRLWKREGVWVLDYRDEDGRRVRKSLSTNKATAERLRSECIHRRDLARAGLGAETGQDLHLEELLDVYLEDLRARASAQHLKNVEPRLRAVVADLGDVRVRDLKAPALVRVRGQAVRDGASHRTANLKIDRLLTMLRWAEESGLVARNPVGKLRRLPETEDHRAYRRRALSEQEIERFLKAAREDDAENELAASLQGLTRVPQAPMWLTLLETGCRYGEMRQVTWGDLDLGRAVLVLRATTTKSKKQRVIPLRAELVEELRRLRVLHETVLGRIPTVSDVVFLSPEGRPYRRPSTNINRVLRRVLDRAGIARFDHEGRKLDVHALRHSFASRLAARGVPLVHTQRLMGHSDPKLTAAVYSHLDVEDLRSAVESLPDTEKQKEAR